MQEIVRKYYGEVLSRSEDLKTNACCTLEPESSDIVVSNCVINLSEDKGGRARRSVSCSEARR